ncbi:MAG: VanZ family protein [Pseudomonadales bacterium]
MLITYRISLLICLTMVTWLALAGSEITDEIPTWDKLNHLLAFLVLAFLIDYCFPGCKQEWIKWVALAGYGLGLEVLQWLSAHRYFELYDLTTDVLGIGLYILGRKLWRLYLFKTNS